MSYACLTSDVAAWKGPVVHRSCNKSQIYVNPAGEREPKSHVMLTRHHSLYRDVCSPRFRRPGPTTEQSGLLSDSVSYPMRSVNLTYIGPAEVGRRPQRGNSVLVCSNILELSDGGVQWMLHVLLSDGQDLPRCYSFGLR